MVLAEAVKFDTGDLVLLMFIVLGGLFMTIVVLGAVGVAIGFAVGRSRFRRSRPGASVEELEVGSRTALVLGGLGLAVLSSILSGYVLAITHAALGVRTVLGTLLPMVLPAFWGAYNGRTRRFPPGGVRRPPPDRPIGSTWDRPEQP